MNASFSTPSTSFNGLRYPVVRLSRKVVRDYKQYNILPEIVQQGQPIDEKMSGSKKRQSERTQDHNNTNIHGLDKIDWNRLKLDAHIRDSGEMRPMVVLERINVQQTLTEIQVSETMVPSIRGKKKVPITPKAKVAAKKPNKNGRPAFVLPMTRSQKK